MKPKYFFNFLMCTGLSWLLTSQAKAISRVGTSSFVIDIDLGFRAPFPRDFIFDQVLTSERFILKAPFMYEGISGNAYQPFLLFTPFQGQIQDLTGLERQEFRAGMRRSFRDWKGYSSANACVDTYLYRDKDRFQGLAIWGPGKGFMVSSGASDIERWGLENLLAQIELLPGACQWE